MKKTFQSRMIFAFVFSLGLFVFQSVSNAMTPQIGDILKYDGEKYHIEQLPLNKILLGKKTPKILAMSSSNWRGYTAKWLISDNELFLTKFTARGEKRDLVIGDIFEGTYLPLKAEWFTGKIELPFGEYDLEKKIWPLMIHVSIEKGDVIDISAIKNSNRTIDWDGSPFEKQPKKSYIKSQKRFFKKSNLPKE